MTEVKDEAPSQVAFRLTKDAEKAKFSGGSVSVGDGETFDIGAALQEGNGTIRVDEGSAEERALNDHPALARGEAEKPAGKPAPKDKE